MADDEPSIDTGRAARTAKLGGLVARQGLRWAGTRAANVARGEEASKRATDRRTVETAEELVARLGQMRGAAMKIGQVLSTIEPVALPDEERDRVKRKLGELRDSVEPVPFKRVRKLIEGELGGPISSRFSDFEEEAFAAASIGQVHRAVTEDGDQVAVKVQYPGVAEAVDADLRNLQILFPLVKRLAPGVDVRAVGAEIRERVSEELDYELEAQNHRRLARAFAGHPFAVVPRVHTDLSSRRVLVTDYVDGRRSSEVRELDEPTRDRFGETLFRFFFTALAHLSLGLGDPHPGNYLLLDDGRVAFLDFGLVRQVPAAHLDQERALARAIGDADAEEVHRLLSSLGYLPAPDSFEPELLLAQLATAGEWLFLPGFRRLKPEYVRELMEAGGSPRSPFFEQMRRQTVPPESLLMRRMEGLLLSVLAELRAGADWAEIVREYAAGAEPSTELGRADAEFWRARGVRT